VKRFKSLKPLLEMDRTKPTLEKVREVAAFRGRFCFLRKGRSDGGKIITDPRFSFANSALLFAFNSLATCPDSQIISGLTRVKRSTATWYLPCPTSKNYWRYAEAFGKGL
jgi:hypothetical protein